MYYLVLIGKDVFIQEEITAEEKLIRSSLGRNNGSSPFPRLDLVRALHEELAVTEHVHNNVQVGL